MVKKKYFVGFFVLIIGLFFLSACVPKCPSGQELINGTCVNVEKNVSKETTTKAPVEKALEKEVEKEEKKKTEKKADVKKEEPVKDETETKAEVNETVNNENKTVEQNVVKSPEDVLNDLKAAYEKNVKNFEFDLNNRHYIVYKLSDSSPGDLIKVGLKKADTLRNYRVGDDVKNLVYYDVVYVDVNNKNKSLTSVQAYCEGVFDKNALFECVNSEIVDVPIDISYNLYKDKFETVLPSEYLYSLFADNTFFKRAEENKYSFKNRAVTVLETTRGKIFYFDPRLGLPLKIEYTKDDGSHAVILFDNLIANKAKFAEMHHRTASEIPPDEMFY
ncbi:hypothetical protein DRJ22_01680 [Candidatus Woesearchaeota archaeon]|nr:MAG: hypothetical protein B6U93_03135 [Candidatus Woesearchaeota archaeon ex4484_78]RLE46525.1 MAG: hypothetical protein DRJ22_01680 [Candidatus Woesearchaeota archaeon]